MMYVALIGTDASTKASVTPSIIGALRVSSGSFLSYATTSAVTALFTLSKTLKISSLCMASSMVVCKPMVERAVRFWQFAGRTADFRLVATC